MQQGPKNLDVYVPKSMLYRELALVMFNHIVRVNLDGARNEVSSNKNVSIYDVKDAKGVIYRLVNWARY